LSFSTTLRFRVPSLSKDEAVCSDPLTQALPEEGPCDEVLMTRVTGGDQNALACLFQRHGHMLRNVAARILGDAAEAEDLVQDLFLFIQRKCSVFDSSKSSARSWIVQMAYHRAIERRRYLSTRQFYGHADLQARAERVVGNPTTETEYSAEAVFGRNGLEKVIGSLSEDQRETLRLHFFEGHTFAEISEKLGQPHGNVRHHYYRGLAALRKQMGENRVRLTKRYAR
jgi:RNA polymerase sigma-70 factor (ECF subfamily)